MTRIITVPDLREHIETDLPEAALQRLIDDADQEIVDSYGPHGSVDETITEEVDGGGNLYLFLRRPAASISSIVEHTSETISKTLAVDDYRLVFGGRALVRRELGANPSTYWPYRVDVTYLPSTDDNVRRRRVVIDLVRLSLSYRGGLKSERAGDYSWTAESYHRERERLIANLGSASGGVRVHV